MRMHELLRQLSDEAKANNKEPYALFTLTQGVFPGKFRQVEDEVWIVESEMMDESKRRGVIKIYFKADSVVSVGVLPDALTGEPRIVPAPGPILK